jgi:hypothetical protein
VLCVCYMLNLIVRTKIYLKDLIEQRNASQEKTRHDLLSNLLAANADEHGILTDSELMGNIFIFVLAGHEVNCDPPSTATVLSNTRPRPIHCVMLSCCLHCIKTNRRNCTSISRVYTQLTDYRYVKCQPIGIFAEHILS